MSVEEPRRSGRAGKGVNPKNIEPSPPPAPKPKPTKKSRGKKNTEEPVEEEEDEEENAIIRCICGDTDDEEGGRMMICCEKCEAWQHNDCMGVPEDADSLPDKYFCEQCRPSLHKELLAAIKRGERPWEEVARRREESKRQKKGRKGRGGRPSAARDLSTPKPDKSSQPSTPAADMAPAVPEKGKRKQASEDIEGTEQPSKLHKASVQDKRSAVPPQSGRKSSSTAPPKDPQEAQAPPESEQVESPTSIANLTEESRKGCATYLKGKFESNVKSLTSSGHFRIPDGETPSSLAEQLALKVEQALFEVHIGKASRPEWGGTYKLQMSSIALNTKENPDLMTRLLNQVITPQQLAKMSSHDMASADLQREIAAMKEEADKQATLITETDKKPMMRRTHKGEEYIEDQSNQVTSETLSSAAIPRRRDSEFPGPQSPTIQQDQQMAEDGAWAGSPGGINRRSSSNFDIKNVWQSVQSPENDQPPRFPAPPQQVQDRQTDGEKGTEDAEIDRLLADDDNESAPYSPGDFQESGIVWRGNVDMPNVGSFKAFAHHVAGSNLSERISSMSNIFPESFSLSGRIHSQKADDYLSSLGAARATDVTVHSIVPADGPTKSDAQTQFDKLFKYFTDRDRWGVVSDATHRDHVTDTYIVPLEAGMSKTPSFLDRLDHNVIEQARPRQMLLAVFVLKWRNQSGHNAQPMNQPGSTPHQNGAQGTTPVAPGANVMSPIATPASAQPAFQFPPPAHPPGQSQHNNHLPHHPQQQQSTGFPENPYNGQQPPQAVSDYQAKAQAILGAFFNTPSANQIINAPEPVEEKLLINLRKIFEQFPETRTDMEALGRILAQQPQQ